MHQPPALVTLRDGQPVTTSLLIAEGTDHEHRAVLKLLRDHLHDFERFGRVAFEVQPFQTAGGVQQRDVAILNEQQATLLVTFMRNIGVVKDFKVRLVKAFYELAQQVRNPGAALTRLDLIKLALDSEERRIAAEAQCQALAQKVEYMTPRAAFADAVAGAVNSITIQEFSKMIGWGPNSLFRRLRTDGILRADNLPMEPYRRRGYFDVKERTRRLDDDGSRAVYTVTMVTGKGQLWLANRYAAGVMQQALQVQPPRSAACA